MKNREEFWLKNFNNVNEEESLKELNDAIELKRK